MDIQDVQGLQICHGDNAFVRKIRQACNAQDAKRWRDSTSFVTAAAAAAVVVDNVSGHGKALQRPRPTQSPNPLAVDSKACRYITFRQNFAILRQGTHGRISNTSGPSLKTRQCFPTCHCQDAYLPVSYLFTTRYMDLLETPSQTKIGQDPRCQSTTRRSDRIQHQTLRS